MDNIEIMEGWEIKKPNMLIDDSWSCHFLLYKPPTWVMRYKFIKYLQFRISSHYHWFLSLKFGIVRFIMEHQSVRLFQ